MTGEVEVRALDVRNVDHIMSVMACAFDAEFNEAWSREQVVGALIMPATQLISIDRDGTSLGFALFRSVLDECELLLIGVLPGWRGHDLGKRLVRDVITRARTLGVVKLFLEVRVTNPAINFYKRLHFSIIGERPNYYASKSGERLKALTMSVDIG